MLLTVYVLCGLMAVGMGRPAQNAETIEQMTRLYALKHPNTEIGTEECSELHAEVDGKPVEPVSNPLNAVVNRNLLWPLGVSYYTIENGVYTTEEIRLIEAGIADLQELTKVNGRQCVTILPRNNEANYVSIENYSGCSSYVGRVGGRQRMSLVPTCVIRHATIMHEFLHAYGFYHEQSRTDRDDYIYVNFTNIQPGTENNFRKYPEGQIDLLGTLYDYGSAMHYGAYGFAIDPTIPTIIPLDPNAEIGQRVTLSKLDIERVQILYGCLDPNDSVYFKGLDMKTFFKS
jgi:hypothetical protein